MQSKEEIENMKKYFNECITKDGIFEEDFTLYFMKIAKEYIEQLERTIKTISEEQTHKQDDYCRHYCNINIEHKYLISDKQKLIEKLEERIRSVEKCYQDLIKPYYDETINMINASFMTKKEKEEFTNKRNCLLVQKHCYKEILEILKGENNE